MATSIISLSILLLGASATLTFADALNKRNNKTENENEKKFRNDNETNFLDFSGGTFGI